MVVRGNRRPRRDLRGDDYEVNRAVVACLDCARAKRQGRPWGCLVHVAEGVL